MTSSHTSVCTRAFTVLELLVVIAVISALAALLLPALAMVRDSSKGAACVSNLRQIGVGISLYAVNHEARIPYGPKALPFTSPANLYPASGSPTSLISLQNGAPVALGLILEYLQDPRVLFCPGSDQTQDADKELAKVGHTQAQGSYYYRHAGVTPLFDAPGELIEPNNLKLANLGENRRGKPVRALAMDSLFLCPPDLGEFNVTPRTHHGERFVNILFVDGHVVTRTNKDGRFTVNLNQGSLRKAFDKILNVFEIADEEP